MCIHFGVLSLQVTDIFAYVRLKRLNKRDILLLGTLADNHSFISDAQKIHMIRSVKLIFCDRV